MRKLLTLLLSSWLAWPVQAQLSLIENLDPPPHMPDDYVIDFREYGDRTGQSLTYSCPTSGEPRPLLVYLDEGYWPDGHDSWQDGYLAPYALDRGYCHVDVRTRQNAKVDEVLADIVAALSYMRENVEEIGHDPTHIVLVGRGSAAAIAGLIGTDPSHLRAGGFDFEILRGVILLEPEALDIGARAAASRRLRESYFPDFYGEEAGRWSRYSATDQLAQPNAPEFYLLGREGKVTFIDVARDFARRLDEAGVAHEFHLLPRLRSLGSEERLSDDPADPTNALGAFLDRAAAR